MQRLARPLFALFSTAALLAAPCAMARSNINDPAHNPVAYSAQNTLRWDKTFAQSSRVLHQKVGYYNRLGIHIVGDLYIPKGLDLSRQHAALVVGNPYGAVKEQAGGLYAQSMAERGFITLVFDASYNGESGGQPRSLVSPEALVEDFSAAVDFLGTRAFVDRNRIGVLGVCASGGYSLAAASADPRMKAVATVVMYDLGSMVRDGLNKQQTHEARQGMLRAAAEQRYVDFEGGQPQLIIGTPQTLAADAPEFVREYYDYYRTPRGAHPRSTTASPLTSAAALFGFYPLANLKQMGERPLLLVAGEKAISRYFSEDAYQAAGPHKELYIVPGATHVDLYDRVDKIPFDKLEAFFKEKLNQPPPSSQPAR